MRTRSNTKTLAMTTLCGVLVSGCLKTDGASTSKKVGFLSGLKKSEAVTPAVHRLANGQVIVAPPSKYCVDQSASTSKEFALLAECGTLQDSPKLPYDARGLLTVSVSATVPNKALPPDAANALGSGESFDTDIDGLAIKRVNSRAAPLPGADSTHWRAAMPINNRIVTFAAYAPPNGALTGDAGRKLLQELAQNTLAASPKGRRSALRVKPEQKQAENSSEPRFGVIGRLFQINQSDTQ